MNLQEQKAQWIAEQERLKQRMVATDDVDFSTDHPPFAGLRHIAGVDLSFEEEEQHGGYSQRALACVVVLEYPSLRVVHEDYLHTTLHLPYIAGFLAFREVQPLIQLHRAIPPQYRPQITLVDGNGMLHPRAFGLACHLGVELDTPTIGIGKNFLEFADGALTMAMVKQRTKAELLKGGDHFELVGASGTVYGAALRPLSSTKNPVFVSVGHRCSLSLAVKLCVAVSRFRIPEPVRQADLRSRDRLRRETARTSTT
ncbi:hypothetical protein RI367_003149 [Sorochytrium milnesiophthora]